MPGPGAVAVVLQTAAFEGGGRPDAALHLRTSFRSKEYALHEACHYQPSFCLLGLSRTFFDILGQ